MKKRLFFFGYFLFFSLLQLLFFWQHKPAPTFPIREIPLQIQTIQLEKPAPKTIRPKKVFVKKTSPQKTIAPSLAKKLQNSLKKISSKKEKNKSASSLPVPFLAKVEKKEGNVIAPKEERYSQKLVCFLQENLQLLEKDEVKLEITIDAKGKLVSFMVLQAGCPKNLHYLKKALPLLHFPCFNGFNKQKSFIINLHGK